jgi:transposase-like protein
MSPEYGLHDLIGQQVLAYAAAHGVPAAAVRFGLHPSTIYHWRRVMRAA